MALTTELSPRELERVAALAYEGQTLKVMLCSVGETGYTAESSVAEWQSAEQSGDGYVRFSAEIPAGSYSNDESRYEIPAIDAFFTSTSLGYIYDRVVVYVDGATYVHSIITEDPNITLSPGQTQTYRILLTCDD